MGPRTGRVHESGLSAIGAPFIGLPQHQYTTGGQGGQKSPAVLWQGQENIPHLSYAETRPLTVFAAPRRAYARRIPVPRFGRVQMPDNILTHIQPGMAVYDREGDEIGKVKAVHTGAGEFTAEWNMATGDELHASFQKERGPLPEEGLSNALRERLIQNGFVRLGGGAADRYVLPEQIDAVEGGRIHLAVVQGEVASF